MPYKKGALTSPKSPKKQQRPPSKTLPKPTRNFQGPHNTLKTPKTHHQKPLWKKKKKKRQSPAKTLQKHPQNPIESPKKSLPPNTNYFLPLLY
jgi:hypothetical protein